VRFAPPFFFVPARAGARATIAAQDGGYIVGATMRWIFAAAAALAIIPEPAAAGQRPMLYDAVALNIGVNCQWQSRCMRQQRSSMKRALNYVTNQRPPQWRVQLCNRNAARGGVRVDWVGFDHCIRNPALKPPPARTKKKKSRR
jgi:hypothetical protein